jgi:hypothetical protein
MTLVPLTECCLYLGVDPKTLRLWLKAAQFSCCLHPTDARLKCLTLPQLQQLASLHGRPLPTALPAVALQPVTLPDAVPGSQQSCSLSSPNPQQAELGHQLSLLQQQVTTLQAQVTELALALLRMSVAPSSPPASSPLAPLAAPATKSLPVPTPVAASAAVKRAAPGAVSSEPEPLTRARSRALPLIAVRPDSSVVVIAPTQGVLPLVPDSAAWFAWLSCIEAFSFEGSAGRFSATRKFRQGQRRKAWNVHRSLHGRSCTLYLGLTPTLTLARLQEMAAAVHARLTAL